MSLITAFKSLGTITFCSMQSYNLNIYLMTLIPFLYSPHAFAPENFCSLSSHLNILSLASVPVTAYDTHISYRFSNVLSTKGNNRETDRRVTTVFNLSAIQSLFSSRKFIFPTIFNSMASSPKVAILEDIKNHLKWSVSPL